MGRFERAQLRYDVRRAQGKPRFAALLAAFKVLFA